MIALEVSRLASAGRQFQGDICHLGLAWCRSRLGMFSILATCIPGFRCVGIVLVFLRAQMSALFVAARRPQMVGWSSCFVQLSSSPKGIESSRVTLVAQLIVKGESKN